MNVRIFSIFFALASIFSSTSIQAQPLDVIESADRPDFSPQAPFDLGRAGAGDDALIAMARFDLFFLGISAGTMFTDNAFSSSINERSDILGQFGLTFGANTTVDEKVDLLAQLNLQSVRYSRFSELDYNQIGGLFSIAYKVDGLWRIGSSYRPYTLQDRNFASQFATYHELSIFTDYLAPFDEQWLLQGSLTASRIWASPNDYDSVRLAAVLGLIWTPAERLVIRGGITLRYTDYDDFFESLTGEDRRDFTVAPYLQVQYQYSTKVTLSASLGFSDNYSTVESVGYESFTLSPQFSVAIRF